MGNVNKLRLLYIYKHLFRYSDEDHPVSTSELLKFLKDEYDMDVNRTTLPGDFAMMEMAGLHFEIVKSRQNKYYFDGRLFDVAELKLLIDAVSSSKFITEKKSKDLIRKLTALTSEYNAEKLRRHVTVEGRVKSENEKAYYILDAINEAIDKSCKIRFQYTEYNNRKRKILKNDKYTGLYHYDDIAIPGGMPQLVSQELYDKVQAQFALNKRGGRPATGDEEDEEPRYWLTGKLYCAKCKSPMHGVYGSGKSHRYYYYACNEQRKHKCSKKPVKKDWIESTVQ